MQRAPLLAFSSFAVALGLAGPASAHAVLKTPAPLTQDDDAKAGPCGCYFGAGPEDPAEDATALPCPADFTVTELEAGSEITVEWLETVNHNGDFRFAFSSKAPDATGKADVDANILAEIPDENGMSGATLTQTITVPSEPCELCTLQLRQFMIGAAQPYYYSCAAVKIVAPPSGTSSSGTGAGTGGSTGNAGGAGQGAQGGGGEGGSTGAGMADPEPTVAEGCALVDGGAAGRRLGLAASLAIAIGLWIRRRRTSGRSSSSRSDPRA